MYRILSWSTYALIYSLTFNTVHKTIMTKTYNIMTFGPPTKRVFQCYSRFWCFIPKTVQKSSNQISYNITLYCNKTNFYLGERNVREVCKSIVDAIISSQLRTISQTSLAYYFQIICILITKISHQESVNIP